jgi:peptide/nickel transport system substrate-binding protein
MGLTLVQTLALDQIFDTLTLLGPDGTALPAAARAWRALDSRTWRFTLSENGAFSNGRAFDAPAVVETFALLKSDRAKRSSAATDLSFIAATKAISATELDITTATPAPLLPAALSVLRIPDPSAYAQAAPGVFGAKPIGSGPFVVDAWEPNRVRMARRDGARRKSDIQSLSIFAIGDEIARLQALVSGALDIAFNIGPDEGPTLARHGARLAERLTTSLALVSFITNRGGPMSDPRVRLALNLATDRQKLIDTFLGGRTAPANQFASPDGFGWDSAMAPIAHDPSAARALLAESGHARGLDLVLCFVPGSTPNDGAIYQQLALDWREIGVRLRLDRIPMARFQNYLFAGGWPADMFGMGMGGFDALRSFRMMSCTWAAPWHCDPGVDALVKKTRAAETLEARRALTHAVMRADRQSHSSLYLWQQVAFDGLGPRIAAMPSTRATVPLDAVKLR